MNQPREPMIYRPSIIQGEPVIVTTQEHTNHALAAVINAENNTVLVNIEIRKKFQRAMQEEPAMRHMMAIIQETTTKKWKLDISRASDVDSDWFKVNGGYPGEVSVFLTLTGPNSDNMLDERDQRLVDLKNAAWGTKNQKREWYIHRVNGEEWKAPTVAERMERQERLGDGMVTYAETESPSDELVGLAFRDIYGVPDQIERVVNLIRTAIESDFRTRPHALLLGKPGCGKSYTLELCERLFFDKSAILRLDGTAMTSAGVIDILEHIETMPRFIFIEEIDKADPAAVQVLLGLMDRHAEIRKSTFRKDIQRECRVCVFATANSLDKVQHMQMGALFSRFGASFITYDRPSDDMLKAILIRELDANGHHPCTKPSLDAHGKKLASCGMCKECKVQNSWIKVTIEWCRANKDKFVIDTLDPRVVIDICLAGREHLLDNQYLARLERTTPTLEDLAEWN